MAEDQVDAQVEESSSSFGELTEREDVSEGAVLVEDKIKPTEETSEESEQSEETGEQTEGEDQTKKEGEEEVDPVTGGKLDKNPQSRAHQELANERKIRGQMEQVLGNPELLAQFMKQQYNIEVPVKGTDNKTTENAPETEFKELKAEDFDNLDDVASKFNEMQRGFSEKIKSYDEKIEKLTGVIQHLVEGGRRTSVASNITSGVDSLQKQPELDPKSPEFIPGLEQKIVDRFNQLDFDEKTNGYRGQYSIEEVGQELIDAARMGRKSGSTKAQTIVKNKTQGAVKTSPSVENEEDVEKLSPADSIALGVSRMFK